MSQLARLGKGKTMTSQCKDCKKEFDSTTDLWTHRAYTPSCSNIWVFGTNPKILEQGDLEKFKHCDLHRYPVGDMEGFDNEVILWVCKMLPDHVHNADKALELHRAGQAVEIDPQTRRAGTIDTYWIIGRLKDVPEKYRLEVEKLGRLTKE